ncbi:MAG TPA: sulfate adenylyltransferase [Candidatus Dormibacteraeota bacterium]|jgi:sulfate adenylyltransferase/3'-phosphoadenosine 5'-phosphosulfate synthase|nr:sulfate adenylyltransferase [Candidatus Dormibacteraeota bacterium]
MTATMTSSTTGAAGATTPARRGATIWLTGLSGAGKSTISELLITELRRRGQAVEVLDGDVVRENLSKGLGFSKEDRDTNIRRIGFVAELLTRNGVFVLVAAISPYREVRDEVRAMVGDFVEVHVDCSIEELTRRDVKGLYAKALAGEIKNFTGVSDPYEAPLNPEVRVDSAVETVEESTARIVAALERLGYLAAAVGAASASVPDAAAAADAASANAAGVASANTPGDVAAASASVPGIAPHGGTLQVRQASPERAAELAREATSLRAVELDAWALSDLELLATGAMSPLTGFLGEADLLSVRDRIRLADGTVWSLPIILPVDESVARAVAPGDRVALAHDGEALAVLTVTEAYRYDRAKLAAEVYGTSETAHPGVARVLEQPEWALAGPVEVIHIPEADFAEYRLTPTQTRQRFAEREWRTVVGFQTRNPVHRAHEYLQKVALEQVDGLLLHPLVGETKGDDIPAATRMRCYEALIEHNYPDARVLLSVFPASMRYAGPREAIFHALVRKNYGCTHFIVGRDHAGVGSYYGSYDAQEIFERFTPEEIGIQLLKFEHAFYCRACASMATTRTCPHGGDERVVLSGTRVREMLRAGEDLPLEFTRPEIAAILREAELARSDQG